MIAAAAVAYMVLTGYKDGTAVIPEPYRNKETCIEAGKQMRRDYAESENGSGITMLSFMCVENPR